MLECRGEKSLGCAVHLDYANKCIPGSPKDYITKEKDEPDRIKSHALILRLHIEVFTHIHIQHAYTHEHVKIHLSFTHSYTNIHNMFNKPPTFELIPHIKGTFYL